jgi:hypothetical protein
MTAPARISREVAWFKAEASRAVGRVSRSRQVFRRLPGAPCARPLHSSDLASLFHVTVRKQLKDTPPAGFSVSSQEFHNVARIGRNAMLVKPPAHEADRLPVLVRQGDAFALRNLFGELLGPLRGVDQIALRVGQGRATMRIANHAKHANS